MKTKTLGAILAVGSSLAVNFLSINLLSLQPTIQIGETALAQSSTLIKFLGWAGKSVGTGALGALGAWSFNHAVQAKPPQPVQQPRKNYVASLFSSQGGSVYIWNPSSGWNWHNGQQFVAIQKPSELLYLTYNYYESNGQYQRETPPVRSGYDPRKGWVVFR